MSSKINPRALLIGRPNVGKSSLFNALLGYRRSIVLDLPGTTVDFIWERLQWDKDGAEREIEVADSKGLLEQGDFQAVSKALGAGGVALWVVDAASGLTPDDKEVANTLRRVGCPVLVVVNKSDKNPHGAAEFLGLGFQDFVEVSAAHRRGLEAILDWLQTYARLVSSEAADIRLAVIGRPNVGKSTLVNRLAGRDVSQVSPVALTTRDPVRVELAYKDKRIALVDTAGVRRPRSKMADVERFSVHATTRAIRQSDVVLLIIAAHEAITDQDMRLLNLLQREGKPCAVLLNFWDRLGRVERATFLKDSDLARHLTDFRVFPISAKTGFDVEKIVPLVLQLRQKSQQRVKTAVLNDVLAKMIAENPPSSAGRSHFNILYASQVKVNPPTFVFFTNRAYQVPESYQRFLEKKIRSRFGYKSQAVRLVFRSANKRGLESRRG